MHILETEIHSFKNIAVQLLNRFFELCQFYKNECNSVSEKIVGLLFIQTVNRLD